MSPIPFVLFILLLSLSLSNTAMENSPQQDFLDPQVLKPYMFKTYITGEINILLPTKKHKKENSHLYHKLIDSTLCYSDHRQSSNFDEYTIQMVKTKQQILPKQLFNQTTIYAYAGNTESGYKASFPGPMILAQKDIPIKVTWRNNIPGPHIMPVDYNYPFKSSQAFIRQVPTVPHAHGIAVKSSSDGEPQAYWTYSGIKSQMYATQEPCAPNEAIFIYPNEQQAGNNWYHDHAIGITRLNVYAGLVGLYKIVDQNSQKQKEIVKTYGKQVSETKTKFLVVTDKTFKLNGQLYYPTESMSKSFTSWVPQFFGNTMLVNGVLWPVLKLNKGNNRIVLLNACQSRYLNIYFENSLGLKVPFKMLRVDNHFYEKEVIINQLLATISTRFQFILDLTQEDGQIVMKNNAPTPFPNGESVTDQFTSQIMKIKIDRPTQQWHQISQNNKIKNVHQKKKNVESIHEKVQSYPRFGQGQKVFTTLFEVFDEDRQMSTMFIDGQSMMNGMECPSSTFKARKTYDFYLINLTPDTHPIHFHLINMQKIKQFPIDVAAYSQAYFKLNGGRPSKHGFPFVHKVIDPQDFRNGENIYPDEIDKVFRDTIDAHPQQVTIIRARFARNDGTQFKTFEMRGQRYVFHCHILQHQDNEMMKYYCIE